MLLRILLPDPLVEGCFIGDHDSTKRLGSLIEINCLAYGFSESDSQDIAQEVLVSIWEKRDSSSMRHHPGGYAASINKGKIVDALRKKAREGKIMVHVELKSGSDGQSDQDGGLSTEDMRQDPMQLSTSILRELLAAISRKVDSLPSKSLRKGWIALSYKIDRDLSLEEIAKIMSTSPGTVKSWISRLRKHLLEELEKDGWDPDDVKV